MDLDRSWTRPGPTPAQTRFDVVLGVLLAALSVVSLEVWRSGYRVELVGHDAITYALFGVAGLLLIGRRRLPLTVLLLESAVFIVVGHRQPEVGVIFTIQIILFVTLYSAWAWSRSTRRLLVTSAVVLVAMFGWLIWQFVDNEPPRAPAVGILSPAAAIIVYSLAINVVYFLGAMAWGHGAWRSARQRAEIAARIADERLAQDRDRELAIQAERVRIARDLHDVVAHHVSGIGVQAAGASRIIEARPDAAREALGVIERSSRQAVQQMHQLVGLLRADDERLDRGPQPGLATLRTLAVTEGRPVVTYREVGEPFDVPPTVGLSLFRIGQEAVANMRRHARASAGEVVVRFMPAGTDEPSAVEVEIIDDGHLAEADRPVVGSGGFGLAGIRERAEMHGGSCEIGPRPDGGFRVRVRIPVAV